MHVCTVHAACILVNMQYALRVKQLSYMSVLARIVMLKNNYFNYACTQTTIIPVRVYINVYTIISAVLL